MEKAAAFRHLNNLNYIFHRENNAKGQRIPPPLYHSLLELLMMQVEIVHSN